MGIAKERMPGQKAATVYLIVFCCSSEVRVLKCRPLPDAAALLEMPKLTKAQIFMVVSQSVDRDRDKISILLTIANEMR